MTSSASLRRTTSPLGRGLSALLGDSRPMSGSIAADSENHAHKITAKSSQSLNAQMKLPVTWLEPGKGQPRDIFEDEALRELADSIRSHGVLQPLVVRSLDSGSTDGTIRNRYSIVAGERRWRAAQLAGLHEVPVIIRNMSDREALEIALIENVQRENLSPLEEARGYKALIDEFGHKQEQLAKAVGKSRPHITNLLRLLKLPAEVQEMIEQGKITAGHARAIATCPDPLALALRIEREGMSVRQAEALAQALADDSKVTHDHALNASEYSQSDAAAASGLTQPRTSAADADIIALARELEEITGLRTKIAAHGGASGSVTFNYKSLDQLDGLLARIRGG